MAQLAMCAPLETFALSNRTLPSRVCRVLLPTRPACQSVCNVRLGTFVLRQHRISSCSSVQWGTFVSLANRLGLPIPARQVRTAVFPDCVWNLSALPAQQAASAVELATVRRQTSAAADTIALEVRQQEPRRWGQLGDLAQLVTTVQ